MEALKLGKEIETHTLKFDTGHALTTLRKKIEKFRTLAQQAETAENPVEKEELKKISKKIEEVDKTISQIDPQKINEVESKIGWMFGPLATFSHWMGATLMPSIGNTLSIGNDYLFAPIVHGLKNLGNGAMSMLAYPLEWVGLKPIADWLRGTTQKTPEEIQQEQTMQSLQGKLSTIIDTLGAASINVAVPIITTENRASVDRAVGTVNAILGMRIVDRIAFLKSVHERLTKETKHNPTLEDVMKIAQQVNVTMLEPSAYPPTTSNNQKS